MKINVIGCSTTWTDRPSSSYCINDKILVDAGEGTMKHYANAGVDFENIECIFITHFHSDHTLATINHIYNACWYQSKNIDKKLTIYGPRGVKKYFFDLIQILMPEYKDMDMSGFLRIEEVDYNNSISIYGLKVNCFKLKHGDLEDVAYCFDDGKTIVGFSGDCTKTDNLDKFVEYCNVLFLECCDFKTNYKHLGYDEFKVYKNKYPEKTFWAIHCDNDFWESAKNLDLNLANQGMVLEYGRTSSPFGAKVQ